jgi:hypothetical protein
MPTTVRVDKTTPEIGGSLTFSGDVTDVVSTVVPLRGGPELRSYIVANATAKASRKSPTPAAMDPPA